MKKRFLSAILIFVLVLTLAPAALADNSKSRVYDNEGLFDEYDTDILNSKLADVSSTYNVDVAILTAISFDGKTAQEYADDFYDETGIGQGENKDGILLLISADERQYAISTCGYAIFAFPDAYIGDMENEFTPYLSDGDWYEACVSYIENCGFYLYEALNDPSGTTPENFDPNDFDNDYNNDYQPITDDDAYDSGHMSLFFNPIWFGAAIILGLIVALIVLSAFKRGMKSVRMQQSASNYVRQDSFSLTESRDTYLYMTVTQTLKPQDDDDDIHGGFGSGGNFSSTHTSSSGSTHGGSSGSF